MADIGAQPGSSIDLYGLYAISEALPDVRLGYVDYTLDDETDWLGDRIQAICNAASSIAFMDDNVLMFTRDQHVAHPATAFNRANMKTNEYQITHEETLPGGLTVCRSPMCIPPRTTKHVSIIAF